MIKKQLLPYLQKDFTRFLRNRGITYSIISTYVIQTKASPIFPALLFQFDKGDFEGYVKVKPIPVNGLNIKFKANTALRLVQKLMKFQYLQTPNLLTYSDINPHYVTNPQKHAEKL